MNPGVGPLKSFGGILKFVCVLDHLLSLYVSFMLGALTKLRSSIQMFDLGSMVVYLPLLEPHGFSPREGGKILDFF